MMSVRGTLDAIGCRPGIAIVALVAPLALACSDGTGPQGTDLERGRAKWEAAAIENYAYDYRRRCFCLPQLTRPVRIQVEDGDVTGGSFLDDGQPVAAADLKLYPTVEDLFIQVQNAVQADADSIVVSYHPELGYPTEAFIDFDRQTIDEEQGFAAENLSRL